MMRVIYHLTIKNIKTILRQSSMLQLIAFSTIIVVGGLYMMFFLSIGQHQQFLTSNDYEKLSFEFICSPKISTYNNVNNLNNLNKDMFSLNCQPLDSNQPSKNSYNTNNKMSLSLLFLRILNHNHLIDTNNNNNELSNFIELLSSLMMNGIPLVGLDDYVYISDFLNSQLGTMGKDDLLNSNNNKYKSKFGNFLDIRNKQLRLVPDNEITNEFYQYLLNSSTVANVIIITIIFTITTTISK